MKRVLFVQHGEVDKLGLFGEVVGSCGLRLEVEHPFRSGHLKQEGLEEFDGFAFGGGGQSAWEIERYPYLEEECALIRSAAEAGKPVLGLCLGGQLIARALGAEVRRAEKKEIGFYPVEMSVNGIGDPLASVFPRRFAAAHWHGDVFELPPGALHLASSAMTPNQMFRVGTKIYGFQFHPEMTPYLFEELVRDEEEWFRGEGINAAALISEATAVLQPLEQCAREFFQGWANLVQGRM